jgi:predicted transcriptional regulator
MSATRTQIYLTEEQRRRIDSLAAADGVTMAAVVRRAVDAYLESETPEPADALQAAFGALAGIEMPDRDGWARG